MLGFDTKGYESGKKNRKKQAAINIMPQLLDFTYVFSVFFRNLRSFDWDLLGFSKFFYHTGLTEVIHEKYQAHLRP